MTDSTTGDGSLNAGSGRLAGKVAVITGGASGIGAGTVRRFVAEGAHVVVADLQAELGEALVAELGSSTRFIRTDVTNEANVAAAIDLAVAEFGTLNIMFNNAGIVGAIGPIASTSADAWNLSMNILVTGAFYGMKHSARVMIPNGSGSILTTSSIAGVIGGLGPHAYTAAKHAVIGLTKSVASELASSGIRVNAIAPGNIVSPMTAGVISGDHEAMERATKHIASSNPLGIAGFPDDIANAAVYLGSDEARYISGHVLVVDGGQTTNGGSARFHQSKPSVVHEAGRRTDM
jgi:NAD(P)-dependent dehydrogenase (short-subunit alcohol dehydrogenase family)